MRRLRLRDEPAPSRAQSSEWQGGDSDPPWPAVLRVGGPEGQKGLPSSSTSSIISCSSSGVGFWPSILITLPSSLVLMQPSSAPSTKMSKAALNSVCPTGDGQWDGQGAAARTPDGQTPGVTDQPAHVPLRPRRSQQERDSSIGAPAWGPHTPRAQPWGLPAGTLGNSPFFCSSVSCSTWRGKGSQDSGSGSSCW